jgi:DNA ligase-1
MLAATAEPDQEFSDSYIVSPKLDGFRCLVIDGVAMSRNLKPIRNKYVQKLLGKRGFNGLDGELIVGTPTEGNVIGRTSSGVTSIEGEPNFTFYVFDCFRDPNQEFQLRVAQATSIVGRLGNDRMRTVVQTLVNADEILVYEQGFLAAGYEGIMLRAPSSRYKFGRATPKEDTFWKLKRFTDGEGVVLRLEEGEHNENEAKSDELGRMRRSSVKAGKRASGLVGTVVIKDIENGEEMRLAPGKMTAVERELYWAHPERLVGRVVHWRAFSYGTKDKVRFPQYYGVRDDV